MTINPDFKGTSLYSTLTISETIQVRHIPLWTVSYMWPIELCHRQLSLLFLSPIESPGGLMKVDIADDLVWPLKVISRSVSGWVHCLHLKNTADYLRCNSGQTNERQTTAAIIVRPLWVQHNHTVFHHHEFISVILILLCSVLKCNTEYWRNSIGRDSITLSSMTPSQR